MIEILAEEELVVGIGFVIRMDVIERLGGARVGNGEVESGNGLSPVASIFDLGSIEFEICDKDFEARFNGQHWTLKYYWKGGRAPVLSNKVSDYN